ncbi:hypothetical protein KHA80_07975 [Anaerobacillus sp. HL2]|nr:hypothetical protein KHA80_07975 [Anaerobacillus sp. HL2]
MEGDDMARTPRPVKGSKDPQVMGEKSVNPMGVSPDHEFSTEPLSKEALIAKEKYRVISFINQKHSIFRWGIDSTYFYIHQQSPSINYSNVIKTSQKLTYFIF